MLLEGGTTILSARPIGGQADGRIDRQLEIQDGARPAPEDRGAIDAARTALCTFLESFAIGPGECRDLLVERLLEGACARHRDEPHASLADCATIHVEQEFESWLTFVLGPERLAGQPALPVGRAAYLACDGPTAWPDLILVCEALPEVFVAAMREAAPLLVPVPAPGTMEAQSLEAWSIAEAGRAAVEVLDANLAWLSHARPLITVPIKPTRPTP
jgi:hypothetical protein